MKLPSALFGYLLLVGAAVVIGLILLFLPPELTNIAFLGIILISVSVGFSILWRQGIIARLWRLIVQIFAAIGQLFWAVIRAAISFFSDIARGILHAVNGLARFVLDLVRLIFRGVSLIAGQIIRSAVDLARHFIQAVASGFRLLVRIIRFIAVQMAKMFIRFVSRPGPALLALFRRTGRGLVSASSHAMQRTRSAGGKTVVVVGSAVRRSPRAIKYGLDRLAQSVLYTLTHPLWSFGMIVRAALWVLDRLAVPVGFVLICLAQYLTTLQEPITSFDFHQDLNAEFRFDLPNQENVLVAILLLIVGGCLLAVGLRRFALPLGRAIVTRSQTFPRIGRLVKILLAITVLSLTILVTNLSLQHGSPPVVLLWVFILFLIALMTFVYDRKAGTTLSGIFSRRDVIYMVIIMAVGFVIAAYRLDRIPNSIIGDEGAFLERGTTIAAGKELLSFFDAGVYSYPLASSFYQGFFLNVFGASLWSWRFSSVVISVFAVIPTYLLALNMFSRRVAIAASLIMITSAYFLAFSRMGYNNAQSIPAVAFTLALLYIGLQRQSLFYSSLAGIVGGIGFYTYTAGRLALVFAVLFMGFLFLRQVILYLVRRFDQESLDLRVDIRTCGVFIAAGIITIMPIFLLARVTDPTTLSEKTLETIFPNVDYALSLYEPEVLYRDHPPIDYENQRFFFRPDLYGDLLLRGVVLSVLVMHVSQGLTNSHYLVAPLPGSIAVVFYFIGLMITMWRCVRRSEFMALILWLASGLLFLSMIDTFPPRYQHLISVIPAISILTAVGIVAFADYLRKVLRITRTGVWVTVAMVVICAVSGLNSYFVDAQQHYQPLIEDILLFHAIQVEQPESVIYVTPEKDFVPYLLKFLPSKSSFYSTDMNGFQTSEFSGIPANACTFFFLPEENNAVIAGLQKKFRQENITPQNYLDYEGRIILESWSSGCRNITEDF